METRRSPLRMLAPLALAVFGLAFLLVIATSGSSDDSATRSENAREEARDLGGKPSERERQAEQQEESADGEEEGPATYTVKEGDTLGGIAESTGVPVERLEELNPGLDQFSLVEGQKIKLR